jgi:hypothetical protein
MNVVAELFHNYASISLTNELPSHIQLALLWQEMVKPNYAPRYFPRDLFEIRFHYKQNAE